MTSSSVHSYGSWNNHSTDRAYSPEGTVRRALGPERIHSYDVDAIREELVHRVNQELAPHGLAFTNGRFAPTAGADMEFAAADKAIAAALAAIDIEEMILPFQRHAEYARERLHDAVIALGFAADAYLAIPKDVQIAPVDIADHVGHLADAIGSLSTITNLIDCASRHEYASELMQVRSTLLEALSLVEVMVYGDDLPQLPL